MNDTRLSVAVVAPTFRSGGLRDFQQSLRKCDPLPDFAFYVLDRLTPSEAGLVEPLNTWEAVLPSPATGLEYAIEPTLNVGGDRAAASAEVVLFAHDFTRVPLGWVAAHLNALKCTGAPFVVGIRLECEGDLDRDDGPLFISGENTRLDTELDFTAVGFANTSVRSEVWRAVGGNDERYAGQHGYSDVDFARRVLVMTGRAGWRWTGPEILIRRLSSRTAPGVHVAGGAEGPSLYRRTIEEAGRPAVRFYTHPVAFSEEVE